MSLCGTDDIVMVLKREPFHENLAIVKKKNSYRTLFFKKNCVLKRKGYVSGYEFIRVITAGVRNVMRVRIPAPMGSPKRVSGRILFYFIY